MATRPCQVVLLGTETQDTVELLDLVGFVQHSFSVSQRRSTTIASPESPLAPAKPPPKGKDAAAAAAAAAAQLPVAQPGAPVTLLFDKTGLGGDPAAPVALEGEEYAKAIVAALNRLSETHAASTSEVDINTPNRIVVIGVPSYHTIEALKQSYHELRMLVTVTSNETFPPPPTAVAAKGAKKPDAKKAPGKVGSRGEKTATGQSVVRLERFLKNTPRYATTVQFVRVHVPTTTAAEGVVLTSVVPELTALESNYAEYAKWIQLKTISSVPLRMGEKYELADVARQAQDVALENGKWTIGNALEGVVQQTVLNKEKHNNPLRNVQRIDVAKRQHQIEERARLRAEAEAQAEGDESRAHLSSQQGSTLNSRQLSPRVAIADPPEVDELPRHGPPLNVQGRGDLHPSDPSQVQWLVRQFMKKSMGKLRHDSEQVLELNDIMQGGVHGANQGRIRSTVSSASPLSRAGTGGPPSAGWTADGIARLTEVVDEKSTNADNGQRPVPNGALLLKRIAAAGGNPVRNTDNAAVEQELLLSVERSHTQREIQRGLTQSMLEQVVKEEFPNLAGANFNLQPYVFAETMDDNAMSKRIGQYIQRFGQDKVKIVRTILEDKDNANNLASAVCNAASVSKVPAPSEIVVVGVSVPSATGVRGKLTASLSASSGVPSFAQFAKWNTLSSGNRIVAVDGNTTVTTVLPSMLKEVMRRPVFIRPTPQSSSTARSSSPMRGKAADSSALYEAVLKDEVRHTIYPYDSCVIDVVRNSTPSGDAQAAHRVRFAKDDVVATLKKTPTHSFFTATFDEGVVFTVEPPVASRPSTEGSSCADPFPPRVGSSQGNFSSARGAGGPQVAPPSRQSVVGTPLEFGSAPSSPNNAESHPLTFTAPVDVPSFNVTLSYNSLSVSVDEAEGNVTYHFSGDAARKTSLEGTLDGETIQNFVEVEVSRTVFHSNSCVTKYFSSGSKQVLGADGVVATLIRRNDRPQSFWLITTAAGEMFVKGDFAQAPPPRKVPGLFCDVRQTCDRENECDVFSRADGVLLCFYRFRRVDNATTDGSILYHTRVVLHTDGTSIVSRFLQHSVQPSAPPALEELFQHCSSLSCIGPVAFVVETPRCPRTFLFANEVVATQEADEMLTTGKSQLFIEFGDGSVLKRQLVKKYDAVGDNTTSKPKKKSDEFLQTVFCKSGETTVRCNHDSGLVFVETHSVHLSPMTMTSIALCEGVGIFDLVLGGFRLVDFKAHVTSVRELFDLSRFPVVDAVVESTETHLLLAMAPTGFSPHILPKKQRNAMKERIEEEQRRQEENGFCIPSLVDRLRDLTAQYIVENRLISKGPRRALNGQVGVTASSVALPSTRSLTVGLPQNKDLAQVTVQMMEPTSVSADFGATLGGTQTSVGTADGDGRLGTARNRFPVFLTEIRPLMFAVYADGTASEMLSAQDIITFVHRVHLSPAAIAVSRSYCSGEPGTEQLSFVGPDVKSFGDSSAMSKFAGSPCEGASWIPRTMLPPRRYLSSIAGSQGSVSASSATSPRALESQNVRILLRYQPMSRPARLTTARQEVRRQEQILSMHAYNQSIESAIYKVPQDELRTQEQLRRKYLDVQPAEDKKHAPTFVSNHAHDQREGGDHDFGVFVGDTQEQHGATIEAGAAAAQRRRSTRKSMASNDELSVSFEPKVAEFGELVAGYRYTIPVVLKSQTTDTLLFEIFRPKRRNDGVQVVSVQTSTFIVSPMGESTIYVLLNVPDDLLESLSLSPDVPDGRIVEEAIRMECVQLKAKYEIKVRATVVPQPPEKLASRAKDQMLSQVMPGNASVPVPPHKVRRSVSPAPKDMKMSTHTRVIGLAV